MNEEKNVSERAADKLLSQMERLKKMYEKASTVENRIKGTLVEPVGQMLVKFCYQDEEFATAIERSERDLTDVIGDIAKHVTRDKPALSDAEAYALAVKCYLPAAEVSVSVRVVLPEELDDDLLFLDVPENTGDEHRAMILDLFDTGEV